MSYVDFGMLAVFLVCMFLVGYALSRWIDTADDFMVAGRHLTPFILAGALTAANVNLYSFVGQSGTAYKYGISIVWQTWTGNMGLVFSGLFIIPILRRLKIRTVPEFLGMRYNVWIRFLVGFYWVLRLAFWLGIVLRAAAIAFMTIARVEGFRLTGQFSFWLLVFALIAVAYTFLGGMWSVTITDVIQFVLMLGGALILLPLVMQQVGWWPGLVGSLPKGHLNLVPGGGPYGWKFILAAWIMGIQWASTDQGLLQMSFSSRDARSAARGLVLAGIITTPFAMLWILPGLAASVIHPGITEMDSAFPTLVQSTLPPILLGIVACGLLSSQLSTISTNLEGVATLFCNDVYKAVLKRQAGPRQTLRVVRAMTFVAGALGIFFAYLIPLIGENVVAAYLTVVGIFDMPYFMITIVFGLLWKRANWQGVLIGYLAGVLAGGISASVYGTDAFFFSIFISSLTTLVVTPPATLVFPPQENSQLDRIWESRTHTGADEGPPFHVIPRSARGRICTVLFFLGLGLFLAGVISGSVNFAGAGAMAAGGMVLYFLSGLLRLAFD
ncbi:MAG: sodium:solute symporter family protein [Candidatus Glassbacteria bacterium]|nr:sodium:solute symporter family protein [Candidatus Glassbacteria bacterium]